MVAGSSVRKFISHRMRVPSKRARSSQSRIATVDGHSKDPLAKKLRHVDDAVRRNDPKALFDLADQALARIGGLLNEIVIEQDRALKQMARVQQRIDRNQAETARILGQLVNRAATN